MSQFYGKSISQSVYDADALRFEYVTTCVGFDDILDETLRDNIPQVDTAIVVTSHADKRTQRVCQKHGATAVQTDLFFKDNRSFNKGAAVNSGFNYFRFYGMRAHMDVDVLLPAKFRHILFNHTHLDRNHLYGCDRVDILGKSNLAKWRQGRLQHEDRKISAEGNIGHRWVDNIDGYLPLGFCQIYHASNQKPYPFSLGDASHDDLMFSATWPRSNRIHLPTIIVGHLIPNASFVGENWEGRKSKRLQ
jgi:hypothetical protein